MFGKEIAINYYCNKCVSLILPDLMLTDFHKKIYSLRR